MARRTVKANTTLEKFMSLTARLRPNQLSNGIKLKKVSIIEAKIIVRNKQLLIKGQAYGTSVNSMYNPQMMFLNVEYSPVKNDTYTVKVDNGSGDIYYMKKLSYKDSKLTVYCSCQDYYFTFWYYNNKHSSHFGGKLKPYVRKTSDWPERNPLKERGICKHLIKLQDNLVKADLLSR